MPLCRHLAILGDDRYHLTTLGETESQHSSTLYNYHCDIALTILGDFNKHHRPTWSFISSLSACIIYKEQILCAYFVNEIDSLFSY